MSVRVCVCVGYKHLCVYVCVSVYVCVCVCVCGGNDSMMIPLSDPPVLRQTLFAYLHQLKGKTWSEIMCHYSVERGAARR